jgi:hypothetical protein
MGLIEDALRETFADQVRTTPVVDDAAGRAIEAARRNRRRRTVVGALAVAAGVAFAVGGVGLVGARPHRDIGVSTVTRPNPPRPVDVRTPTTIITRDGRTISLQGLPTVLEVLRVDDGWLVVTEGPRVRSLHYIDEDGVRTWLTDGDHILVSPDGRRVAWSVGPGISIGERTGGTLKLGPHTGGAGGLAPVAFAGGGLVLVTIEANPIQSDVWYPSTGAYVAGARTRARVAAATADGAQVFALVGPTYPCLAVLNPVGLSTARRACDLTLRLDDTLVPSPDGRWLLVLAPERVDLYDLDEVWRVQAPAASWTVVAQRVAWVDARTFVLNGHGELLRGYVDVPGQLDEIAVDAGADGDVTPIAVAHP